ncbi:MAG TPA: helicase-associated domain-containing protein, partial [Limnochordia bacterium]
MRLASWLTEEGPGAAGRLAQRLALETGRIDDPGALARAAVSAWPERIETLSEHERDALRLLVAWPWHEPPRANRVGALLGETHKTPRALRRLIDWGIVLPHEKPPYTVYEIADEALPLAVEAACGHRLEAIAYRADPPPIIDRGEGRLGELFHLLCAARIGALSVTKTGRMYKRSVQAIWQRLQKGQRPILDALGDFRPTFFVRLALVLNLLRTDGVHRTIRLGAAATDFLAASPSERLAAALSAWERVIAPRHRRARLLYALLRLAPASAWAELGSLRRILTALTEEFIAHCRRNATVSIGTPAHVESAVCHLLALGLVEAGGSPPRPETEGPMHSQELWLRLSPIGQGFLADGSVPPLAPEEGRFIVQPNFEVVAPPDVAWPLLWKLEETAALARADQASVYRLDRPSIIGALRAGRTPQEIESFLAAHSRTGLPQNVAYQITAWAGGFGRVALARAVILLADTPDL